MSTFSVGNSVAAGNTSLCNAGRGVAVGDHSTAAGNAVSVGYFSSASASNATAIGNGATASASSAIAIGSGASNSTANSCCVGNSSIANLRPNNNNKCDLGVETTNTFKDIYANGSLIGGTNSRTIDNIVSNSGSGTSGNLASFSSNKVIQDAGVVAASVVTGPASAVSDRITTFNGTTGKLIKDSGTSIFDVVTGPASATNNNLASYNLTSGKIIKDSGILTSNVFVADGSVSMSGVLNQANTTQSTATNNGSIVTLGGVGVAKNVNIGVSQVRFQLPQALLFHQLVAS